MMATPKHDYDPEQAAKEQGLIWISEAMLEYKHAREWFMRRIDDGRLEQFLMPGTPKVYLRRAQIEAVEQDDRRK